jgi:hypothetical protein
MPVSYYKKDHNCTVKKVSRGSGSSDADKLMCVELEEAKANRGCFKEMHLDIIVN